MEKESLPCGILMTYYQNSSRSLNYFSCHDQISRIIRIGDAKPLCPNMVLIKDLQDSVSVFVRPTPESQKFETLN